MKIKLLFSLILISTFTISIDKPEKKEITSLNPKGTKIFVVNYDYQADIKVFVVNYDYQADLKVFKVEYDYQAKDEGEWYFTDYDYQADKKIYFTDYDYQADLKVFFVEYDYQAGWNNKSKMHLLY